jgi:hypothetical protein
MSTKFTLKSQHRDGNEPSFHLYHDVFEEWACEADGSEPPVYLCLEGVEVELQTVRQGGATVTVKIPRATARALGLVPDPSRASALDLPRAEDSR